MQLHRSVNYELASIHQLHYTSLKFASTVTLFAGLIHSRNRFFQRRQTRRLLRFDVISTVTNESSFKVYALYASWRYKVHPVYGEKLLQSPRADGAYDNGTEDVVHVNGFVVAEVGIMIGRTTELQTPAGSHAVYMLQP